MAVRHEMKAGSAGWRVVRSGLQRWSGAGGQVVLVSDIPLKGLRREKVYSR